MSHTNHIFDDDLREPEKARTAIFELETLAIAVRRAIEALASLDRMVNVIPRYLFVRRFTGAATDALKYVLRLIVEELTTRRRWVPAAPKSTSEGIASGWGDDLLTQKKSTFPVHIHSNEDFRAYGNYREPIDMADLQSQLERIFASRGVK